MSDQPHEHDILDQWTQKVGAWCAGREQEDVERLSEPQQAFLRLLRMLHYQRTTGRDGDPQMQQQVLSIIEEQPAWLAFLDDLKTWHCAACQRDLPCATERPADSVHPVDPAHHHIWLHTFIHLCETCQQQGYTLHLGEVRVWPESPADRESVSFRRMTEPCNPFVPMDRWPRGGRGASDRESALRGYYRYTSR